MLELIISLSGSWVLSHRGDDLLPIDCLTKLLGDYYGSRMSVEDEGLTELVVRINKGKESESDIVNKIIAIFSEKYSVEDAKQIISVKVNKVEESFEKTDAAKLDGYSWSTIADMLGNGSDDGGAAADSGYKDAIERCLEKINSLIGADEFKALAKEIVDIAPQIRKNGTAEILSRQSYIFSINEGCGLSTYLLTLKELFEAIKISDIGINGIEEITINLPKTETDDPFPRIGSNIMSSGSKGKKIFCIDISQWMSKVNNAAFKRFVSDLSKRMSDYIVIFRIPFVDKGVLSQVRFALNDLMYVRTVTFPPFNHDELQACAKKELDKYGFTMSEDAWEGFHIRIAEEKRDGKFYGINTVKKVVTELLYKKQLSNVRCGNDDTNITKDDIAEICENIHDAALSGYDMLDRMIGGEVFKTKINEIISQIEFARSSPELDIPCIHMRFVGNPGTGKTTVARIVGKILKERGILRIGSFFEYAGRDFCGRYIGETAPKTAAICRDAYGSVLFIDEAYSLYRGDGNDRDFGREALDTLIAEMENHRTDLVVIMAGYTDDMDILMEGNAGLASRMPYVIEFPNFTKEELYKIFVTMLRGKFEYDPDMLPAVEEYFNGIPDQVIKSKEFSNARFVRNLFERTWAKASMRCQLEKLDKVVLTKDDFNRAIADKEFCFATADKKSKIGFLK